MTELGALMVDPLLGWLAVACTATLLGHAALDKLRDRSLTEQHLAAYGMPGPLLAPLSWALPLAEALAAALLLSPWRSAGALLAAALLAGYGAAMAWHRWHGHRLDCGCGGEPLAVGWPLVARNALLTALALAAGLPQGQRALGLADMAVLAGALALASLLYAALHQLLRTQGPQVQRS